MKFLPENKRKTTWLLAILLISIGGILYINFFRGENEPVASSPGPIPGETQAGGFLPYGSKIDARILTDEKFTVLRAPPPLTVDPSELGKSNLFRNE